MCVGDKIIFSLSALGGQQQGCGYEAVANLFMLFAAGSQPARTELEPFEAQIQVYLHQCSLVLTFMSDEKAEHSVPYEAQFSMFP